MIAMLDLASMTNEDFCTPVTPPVPQTSARIVVDEFGMVSLSNNLALAFSKKPVQLRFNKDRTAIQISHAESATDPFCIVFPKSGRKLLPNAQELLKQKQIAFPAIFRSCEPPDGEVWRGAYVPNPTTSSRPASPAKKKK